MTWLPYKAISRVCTEGTRLVTKAQSFAPARDAYAEYEIATFPVDAATISVMPASFKAAIVTDACLSLNDEVGPCLSSLMKIFGQPSISPRFVARINGEPPSPSDRLGLGFLTGNSSR